MNFSTPRIDIPDIPSAEALGRILTRRVAIVVEDSEHAGAVAANQ
ncbi:MAG: hypothetical protein ACRDJT_01980 [Actinomycetota bacterium]